MTPSRFRCTACGEIVDEERDLPFRCPAARDGGDDVDHVVARLLATIEFPEETGGNPFLTYRELLHTRHFGRAHGLDDDSLDDVIARLDAAVAGVDGRGFVVTPFERVPALETELDVGCVLVKDETGNVAGSHKARHLFGVLTYLEVRENLGLGPGRHTPLAIASCGNAALAAAVLAKAAGRRLLVFVPEAADDEVIARLRDLAAEVTVCPRSPDATGDPSVANFRAAVADGALPFTCQGNENGLAIEGGQTLGWEMASALRETGVELDRLFVQVGGGALASACIVALREAKAAGVISRLPRIHAVQTIGGHPLRRAYDRIVERIAERLEPRRILLPPDPDRRGEEIAARFHDPIVRDELRHAALHRSEFMRPWEDTPTSLAAGILDDETYDWRLVLSGLLESGGYPVVVDENAIARANELGRATHDPSYTGTSGLAGLLDLAGDRTEARDQCSAVLFTGERRGRGD